MYIGAQWSVFFAPSRIPEKTDGPWKSRIVWLRLLVLRLLARSDDYMFNYRVLFQGIAFSGYLRYIYFMGSHLAAMEGLSRQGTTTRRLPLPPGSFSHSFNLNMLLSILTISRLIFSVLLLISYSLGLLIWVYFFTLTLLTITQEGTIKKRKESNSVSQSIRSGQLLTLIIHRLWPWENL